MQSNIVDKVTLRQPPNNQVGYYVKNLLERVYLESGKVVEFIKVPGARELQMAEQGLLVGALARQVGIEKQNKTLIRIPLPIFTFKLMQVSNSKQCAECKLENLKLINQLC
ncbi:hypothetical protein CJF42_23825 [Pseudoalteromonas sp. NBT06-2]|uniref:hypothetical protein n=1 Tax=Pseudoalteromonas sp. NBT06-2 TaxID=2025950 RepID=UPI000BA61F63|nr:hypothetical protein [Pseudoalteromonas sp. NBT06-2]PAJ71956.1 hypothetical protein CJF42_23825 [Pseudoalteromonas sp. NBT06-2]